MQYVCKPVGIVATQRHNYAHLGASSLKSGSLFEELNNMSVGLGCGARREGTAVLSARNVLYT